MRYQSVIFDLDGTLSDNSEGIMKGVRYAMEHFKVLDIPDETLRKFIGPPLHDTFSSIFGLSHEDADRAVALYREYYRPTGIFQNRLYAGIVHMLSTLKNNGTKLYVCTSKPQEMTDRILNYFGITDMFEQVIGASLDRSMNSKAALLARLVETAQPPMPAVMVGDTRFDIEGAAACHLPAIAVEWGFGEPEELSGAVCRVSSPMELVQYLCGEKKND